MPSDLVDQVLGDSSASRSTGQEDHDCHQSDLPRHPQQSHWPDDARPEAVRTREVRNADHYSRASEGHIRRPG